MLEKLIGRALRGVLAGFFKTSDARQVVDGGASSVMNACRARLRMTPLALRVAKKGSYRYGVLDELLFYGPGRFEFRVNSKLHTPNGPAPIYVYPPPPPVS